VKLRQKGTVFLMVKLAALVAGAQAESLNVYIFCGMTVGR
jgi:hypothetical protein